MVKIFGGPLSLFENFARRRQTAIRAFWQKPSEIPVYKRKPGDGVWNYAVGGLLVLGAVGCSQDIYNIVAKK